MAHGAPQGTVQRLYPCAARNLMKYSAKQLPKAITLLSLWTMGADGHQPNRASDGRMARLVGNGLQNSPLNQRSGCSKSRSPSDVSSLTR